MKIGFLAMFCRKFPKKLGFSIPLMKSSPPNTWKMDFWRNFVQILEKNRIFDYLDVKEPPTHENWFQRHFVKISEKNQVLLLF